MYLLWIRHAQSNNNAGEGDPNYKHEPDAALTQLGVTQANHLAGAFRRDVESEEQQAALNADPNLPIFRADMLFCSPMKRAIQTAKPLAEALDLPLTVMPDIYEYGGAYQRVNENGRRQYIGVPGLNRTQMQAMVANIQVPEAVSDDGWWSPQEGFEPDAHYFQRGRNFAAYLKAQSRGKWRGKWVVMISHADFTNMLIKLLLMGNIDEHPHATSFIYPYNTSVTRIDFAADGYPILRFASKVDHLPTQMITF
jgi:2,3-bisphosphoglycerate-dependent phosphoglycerate mutase